MGNVSIYLPAEHKEKLKRIMETTSTKPTTIVRVIFKQMPESYLIELVNNYKEQELHDSSLK